MKEDEIRGSEEDLNTFKHNWWISFYFVDVVLIVLLTCFIMNSLLLIEENVHYN
jgi:hypothetical protein